MFNNASNAIAGAEYEKMRQETAYNKTAHTVDAPDVSSLLRLADQVSEATARLDYVSDNLSGLALALHGPRPEPVHDEVGKPVADSLTARVAYLLSAVGRIERAYQNVMR